MIEYKGVVKLTVDGKEYVMHNTGLDYLFQVIMTYLMDGSKSRGGFLNFFDVGYKNDTTWVSIFNRPVAIKAKRFTNANSASTINFEGNIPPEVLQVASYTGKQFYIRVLETTNQSTALAEVEMAENVNEYFQEHLSAVTEIMIQWQMSFS